MTWSGVVLLTRFIVQLFQAKYPGFEPFMEGAIPTKPLQNVVKLRVTKSLG